MHYGVHNPLCPPYLKGDDESEVRSQKIPLLAAGFCILVNTFWLAI
jgi:hypothetical protein